MKLKTYTFLQGQTLLNRNGRLSLCHCCCDYPDTLYLHVVPLYGDADCEGFDQGTEIVFNGGEQFPGNSPVGHCHDFNIGHVEGQTLDDFFRCNNGTPEPGSPQTLWSLAALFYCDAVDEPRLSLCIGAPDAFVDPGWPFSSCYTQYEGLVPTSSLTCDAMPGDFYAEFTADENGDPLYPADCICPFLFRVDEKQQYFPPSAYIYPYPRESKRGLPSVMRPMLEFFEFVPSVQTPPDLNNLLDACNHRRVGKVLNGWMLAADVRYHQDIACGRKVTTKLNQWQVAGIRKHLQYWEPELKAAMRDWYVRVDGKRLPVSDKLRDRSRELLERCCDVAEFNGGK